MKQAKRILSLVLLLSMLLSVLPMSVGAAGMVYKGSCGEGVNWTLDTETGILQISGNGAIMDYYSYSAPWSSHRKSIRSVIIQDGITEIGNYAFYESTNIKSVRIPDGVTRIGDWAFRNVTALDAVVLPASLVTLGDNAFGACASLKEIVLPKKLTAIGKSAFVACYALKKVTMNDGLTSIGSEAFNLCKALEEIVIPDTVTSIGVKAFAFNDALKKAVISDNVAVLSDSAFYNCYNLITLDLPENLKTIENKVFAYCERLKGVVLPAGLEYIGDEAFRGTAIERVILPSSVTLVGASCFRADSLTDIAVLGQNCEHRTYGSSSLGTVGKSTVYCYPNTPTYDFAVKNGYAIEYITEDNLWADEIELIPDMPDPADNPFKDVKEKDYFFSSVLWAVEKGITAGVSATSFAPNDVCTRAQIVSFLWRAKGQPEPKTQKNPFADVRSSDYFYKAVLWAVENGITAGVDATHFAPNQACTRAQAAAFLHRSEGNSEVVQASNPFRDVSSREYYYNAVLWAVKNEITAGTSSTTFSPNDHCTRAQIVAFLYRSYH